MKKILALSNLFLAANAFDFAIEELLQEAVKLVENKNATKMHPGKFEPKVYKNH